MEAHNGYLITEDLIPPEYIVAVFRWDYVLSEWSYHWGPSGKGRP